MVLLVFHRIPPASLQHPDDALDLEDNAPYPPTYDHMENKEWRRSDQMTASCRFVFFSFIQKQKIDDDDERGKLKVTVECVFPRVERTLRWHT